MLYKNLNDSERRNLQKAATHMAMVAITMGTIMALRPREDEEVSREQYYALYWSSRLRSELMIFLNPVTEGTKLLRSPAASMMVLEKSIKLMSLLASAPVDLMTDGHLEQYQRRVGSWEKGSPKLYKAIVDMVPGLNAMDNSLSPEEAYKWYTGLFSR